MMKRIAALAVFLVTLGSSALPAFARDAYVIDNAGLLSAATVSALNAKIGDFNAQTHKEVVVDVESTVTGDPKAAAERIYAQQQVNGVLIFIAKQPKTIGVIPDRAAASYFPAGSTSAIRSAIASGFNAGNFDEGVTNGVDLTINMYRSHLGALRHAEATVPAYTQPVRSDTGGGFPMHWIFVLIVLAVIFFIIRGIFRAMSGPRMVPPGYGGQMGGPGYGGGYGPGYGGGPMGGGGGGSFFSGLLGGLGGAFLGNELFGNRGETIINPGQTAGFGDPGSANYGGGDQSGFQSDPGQADMGNSSFGGWGGGGDSGGGGGWGGGDSGGGGWGGGDSGGGGGDSGGGW